MTVDICISLDSEDFLTPESADAELWWAQELSARGIRGTFHMVGELVRRLQQSGRQDVIDAIAKHDIGFHTDYHSVPPAHPQALQHMTLEEGVKWVLEREEPCFAAIRDAFGCDPVSYVSPGDSWTPASLIAMASKGIHNWAAHMLPIPKQDIRPFWYCGLLATRYAVYPDGHFMKEHDATDEFLADVRQAIEGSTDDGVLVIGTHPCRVMTAVWWDQPFNAGKPTPREQWGPAPLWSPAKVQRIKDQLRHWLDRLQTWPGTRMTNLPEVYRRCAAKKTRTLDELLAECRLSAGDAQRLPVRPARSGTHLSDEMLQQIKYRWIRHPADLDARQLVEQARGLAWTSAAASGRN